MANLKSESWKEQQGYNKLRFLISVIMLLSLSSSFAQQLISIQSPVNNQIVQRDSSGFATISLTGYIQYPFSRLEARLTPAAGNLHPEVFASIDNAQISQGFFYKSMVAGSGWYKLTLTGFSNTGVVASAEVAKVGIGEVFLIAGNSNAMGLPELGAKSGTENVISFNAVNKILNDENITVAPDLPMPALQFSPIDSKNNIFPSGETAWYWGELGEMLFKKTGVPILFLNAAWAAANSENYHDGASGKDAYNLYVGKYWPNRQPYSNIKNTLKYFNSWLGIRAVLWAHGENDAQLGFTENAYFENISTLIETSREDAGFKASWIMARSSASSTISQPYQPIINAQNRFFADKNRLVYPGPDLDRIQIPRPAHGHFENITNGVQGLTDAAKAWNTLLTDSLLAEIKPVLPAYTIHTGVTPLEVKQGSSFLLPYIITGSSLNVQAELLDNSDSYVATVATGNRSPLTVTIPDNIKNGTYKIRIIGTSPTLPGSISSRIFINTALPANQYVNHIHARREDSEIHIAWLVSANTQIGNIILQKTTDGLNYTDITSLQPVDNQSTSHLYTYSDTNTGNGTLFYRVILEFANGSKTVSPISTVFAEGSTPYLLVFPNPVTDQTFRFRINPEDELLECRLYDVKGREFVLNTNEREMSGAITARPAGHIPSGTYILKIVTDTGSTSQSIFVL